MSHVLAVIRRARAAVATVAVAGAAVALILTLFQPFEYRATMRILIIQATSPTLDAFTAVKSSEKVGKNLGRVLTSSAFLATALQANPTIDAAYFPADERKRRRLWGRSVESFVAAETSVMEVHVFHTRQSQAKAIAETLGAVLVRDAHEYTGSKDIAMKVIDPPLVTPYPVRPNTILRALLGLIIGALLGGAWVYLRRGHTPTHVG